MRHPERIKDYLGHISQAIERATRYLQDVGRLQDLERDTKTQDAIIRAIEIIGEAANRIQNTAPAFVHAHPELPWTEMRGMRNKLIHEYFDVDWAMVWDTVKRDLPILKTQVESLLRLDRGAADAPDDARE
jgi:uncharacterized protein with HEPN domain